MHTSKLLKFSNFSIGLLISLPILVILAAFFQPDPEIWAQLTETRIGELLWNTFRLSLGVGIGTMVLGTSLAWIVVMYDFPGKRLLESALILPLAIPSYVIGFVYLSSFEYGSIFPVLLQNLLGIKGWYPDIRGYWGVVVLMTLVLYPYVYLLSRAAFKEQNVTLLEAAQGLGTRRSHLLWKVAIPMARPSIFAGVSLAIMESLADFGLVAVFSYDTFTTAIYDAWFGMFNRTVATQLASFLLLFNFIFFWMESRTKKQAQYYQVHGGRKKLTPRKARGMKGVMMLIYGSMVLLIAFLIPVMILFYWAFQSGWASLDETLMQAVQNTVLLGSLAAVVIVFLAILLSYGKRLIPGKFLSLVVRFASMGYAIPGSVIAVGVLIPLAWLDHRINGLTEQTLGFSVGLLLSGTLFAILFAYVVRFMTIGFNTIKASLEKITPSMDMAARNLGESQMGVLRRVHFRLLRTGMATAFILILVETMKEMPATLLMRPFGFDTLATRIWQLMSESLAEEAAMPSLLIVLSGLIPILLMVRISHQPKS